MGHQRYFNVYSSSVGEVHRLYGTQRADDRIKSNNKMNISTGCVCAIAVYIKKREEEVMGLEWPYRLDFDWFRTKQ
jgi:hypothetical protein